MYFFDVKILIVNNYVSDLEKVELLTRRVSQIAGGSLEVMGFADLDGTDVSAFDVLVLSGSDRVTLSKPKWIEACKREISFLLAFRGPVLGICGGHQVIGVAWGGRVIDQGYRVSGYLPVKVLRKDTIFEGLGDTIMVSEAHREAVSSVMRGFVQLAEGAGRGVEMFRHEARPIYGVQFHPERYSSEYPDGHTIMKNFFGMV